ncbi:MAG: argininosuccinate lyase [Myxococcota bacterium]|nr:argininosuccinate lyase [Myxococcota bacterium]MDW8362685.1 argininosuccinate lyase [Myxococcales bacterium]
MGAQPTWGGRFAEEPDARAARFTASVDVDRRLGPQDVAGSIAHVRMLAARGILPSDEASVLVAALERIAREIEEGRFAWDPSREDVHMNVEARLAQLVGSDLAGKLHTARSRNDQVATDLRLWTREACAGTARRIDALLSVLHARATETVDILLPGYTHLQRAQPVRLAHHLLAWAEMLERDRGRLRDAARRMNECPLGSGALAGTGFPLDRDATAQALGFDRPTANSLDAVADRDFAVEAVAALACLAVHLSRVAEELVLWSSREFGFLRLADAWCTGSSMMPQKRNPDVAELVRGKCGRVVGDLVALLVLLKGLPLAYNRDLQEDKPPLFDAFDTVDACLEVLAGAMETAHFDAERMHAALAEGHLEATDLADWLAGRGVPFRQAHHVVGRLVARAEAEGRRLAELPLETLRAEHPAFDATVYDALRPEALVERRDGFGGPSRRRVLEALDALGRRLASRDWP